MGRAKAGKKPLSPDLEATGRMARKLRTKRGEKSYRKRKRIGEPPFSWIQAVMGFDPFHLRGLLKTIGEWDLACLAANLRRMQRRREWT
jgi:IS5 family transposase